LKQTNKITDELLQRCIQNDRTAIRVLYEICFEMLMNVCLRYHSHQEDARSSFHLAFMKILKHLQSAPIGSAFYAWSKRITVNTLIDEYRKQKNHTQKEQGKQNDYEIETHGDKPQNEGQQKIEYDTIIQLVAQLPNISSKVFNLYVIEGYSHKEIANLLNITTGTSKWHLSNARKLLREKLELIEQNEKKINAII